MENLGEKKIRRSGEKREREQEKSSFRQGKAQDAAPKVAKNKNLL